MSQWSSLLSKGWLVFNPFESADLSLTETEKNAFTIWEETFKTAFNLPSEVKIKSGEYRVEHGVSVGYRHDEEREFFESRLTSLRECEPNFSSNISNYNDIVLNIYSACSKIGISILNEISDELGLDRNMIIDLTDLRQAGVLDRVNSINKNKKVGKVKTSTDDSIVEQLGSNTDAASVIVEEEPQTRIQYSSSLLRICKYIHNLQETINKKSVSFGAHTDSSFITIAPVSSSPGLEVVDQVENIWICPEQPCSHDVSLKGCVVVFVGEFLQVLTKNRFKATVHRVVEFPNNRVINDDNDCSNSHSSSSCCGQMRLSSPFLIRGRNDAIINFNDPKYHHAEGSITADKVPDLDGTNMKLLHKLLDLKRQKCFRDNDSKPGNWVLSAYPIDKMPLEDDVDGLNES